MLSFKQITKSIVGIAVLGVLAISCGKKSGGGGSTATAPNCEAGNTCTVGQTYASGVFFRSAVGQANLGNNQNLLAKLAFYAKNSGGLNTNTNPVTYSNGQFDVTGTIRVADGRYYGVSSTAQRTVAFFGIQFEFGYSAPQYTYGQDSYWYPCGYNDPNCGGNGGYYPPPNNNNNNCQYYGNCNGGNNNNNYCNIPVGDYAVTTIQSGNWNGGNGYGYNNESFNNLKIRFTSGGNVVDATFSQGYLQSNGYNSNNGSSVLRGTMTINTVNNQSCNRSVSF